MKEAELRELYKMTCDGKGFLGNDGQFRLWKQTLGWAEQVDVAQALVWYFENNTEFPMPAVLRPLIEKSRLSRVARSTASEVEVHWECPKCGYRVCGFIAEGASTRRYCRSHYGPVGSNEMLPANTECSADMVVESMRSAAQLKEARLTMGNKA